MRMLTALTVALLAAAAARADVQPTPLPKTSKWDLSYDSRSCDLVATFSNGSRDVVARFARFSPDRNFDLTLIVRPLRPGDLVPNTTLDFGPATEPRTVHGLVAGSKDTSILFFGTQSPRARVNSTETNGVAASSVFDQIDKLTVVNGDKAFTLALGRMKQPMEALTKCTDNLVRAWGYDPAQQSALRQPPLPIGNPEHWLNPSDISPLMQDLGLPGVVHFRLDVDAKGNTTQCQVLSITGSGFADATCDLLRRRARFRPAVDSDGKPVRSFWVNSVRWYPVGLP